jgi:hypothetical protein
MRQAFRCAAAGVLGGDVPIAPARHGLPHYRPIPAAARMPGRSGGDRSGKDVEAMVQAIFVVGTGRSGTHFTCRALAGFANVTDPLGGNENHDVLKEIATAALYHRSLPTSVLAYYSERRAELAPGQVLLDQHHPNIFFFQQISKVFDDLIYLFPARPVVQVIASMMRHRGVMSWYQVARDGYSPLSFTKRVPVPNRFLGIRDRADLDTLPTHLLCALRVLAHNRQMAELAAADPRCRVVSYQALVHDQEAAFARVFDDAERESLGAFSVVEPGNPASLEKYTDVLTATQIREIHDLEAQISPAPLPPRRPQAYRMPLQG